MAFLCMKLSLDRFILVVTDCVETFTLVFIGGLTLKQDAYDHGQSNDCDQADN